MIRCTGYVLRLIEAIEVCVCNSPDTNDYIKFLYEGL